MFNFNAISVKNNIYIYYNITYRFNIPTYNSNYNIFLIIFRFLVFKCILIEYSIIFYRYINLN